MSNLQRYIVPLLRGTLALLLLFSMTESLRGVCPHMGSMQQKMEPKVEERSSCCSDSPKEEEQSQSESRRSCCADSGHFCTCYPPLVIFPASAIAEIASCSLTLPAPLLEEALYDASHEPVIPPPKA